MKAQYVKDLRPYNSAAIVSQDALIRDMVEIIVKYPELHYLCVTDESGKLKGLIGRKRLFQAIFSHHVSASEMVSQLYTLLTSQQASDLLIKHVVTCRETDTVNELIDLLVKHNLDAIPVVNEEGKLEGIISIQRLFSEWLKEN